MRILLVVTTALVLTIGVGCGSAADTTTAPAGEQTPYGAEVGTPGESEGDVGDDDPSAVDGDAPLVAADESIPGSMEPFAAATAKTTANLNLRKGPGTSYAILAVIPAGTTVGVVSTTPQNGFLNISFNGSTGWSHSGYLTVSTTGGDTGGVSGVVDVNGAASPDNAIARAKAAVGFSYWWGGGAWLATGATSSNKGSCSGSCPSCSHSGKYGADCSGLVAKTWQFGTKDLAANSHPYSTVSFNSDSSGKWYTVSRGSMKKGDALVYNSSGAGHIALYEKGDGWGSPTVYECRGCAYGCVYNARSFTSKYHAIRRSGF
jgi:cell wall-associated NlpC family hydrolase